MIADTPKLLLTTQQVNRPFDIKRCVKFFEDSETYQSEKITSHAILRRKIKSDQ